MARKTKTRTRARRTPVSPCDARLGRLVYVNKRALKCCIPRMTEDGASLNAHHESLAGNSGAHPGLGDGWVPAIISHAHELKEKSGIKYTGMYELSFGKYSSWRQALEYFVATGWARPEGWQPFVVVAWLEKTENLVYVDEHDPPRPEKPKTPAWYYVQMQACMQEEESAARKQKAMQARRRGQGRQCTRRGQGRQCTRGTDPTPEKTTSIMTTCLARCPPKVKFKFMKRAQHVDICTPAVRATATYDMAPPHLVARGTTAAEAVVAAIIAGDGYNHRSRDDFMKAQSDPPQHVDADWECV